MPTLRDGTVPMIAHGSVYLRAAERADIPLFVAWFNDYATSRTLSIRAPMSTASEEHWFEQTVADQGKGGYHFVACLIEDDRPIGGRSASSTSTTSTGARRSGSRSARPETGARATDRR